VLNTPENHALRNAKVAAPLDLLAPVFHDSKHSIKIYQGDCVEILEKFPPESVDLIFADPPYFFRTTASLVTRGGW
jgi:site-specific DNA-methyltransferase (adenine-specific)